MTLNEAIELRQRYEGVCFCADEHEQLSEWLEELKKFRDMLPQIQYLLWLGADYAGYEGCRRDELEFVKMSKILSRGDTVMNMIDLVAGEFEDIMLEVKTSNLEEYERIVERSKKPFEPSVADRELSEKFRKGEELNDLEKFQRFVLCITIIWVEKHICYSPYKYDGYIDFWREALQDYLAEEWGFYLTKNQRYYPVNVVADALMVMGKLGEVTEKCDNLLAYAEIS